MLAALRVSLRRVVPGLSRKQTVECVWFRVLLFSWFFDFPSSASSESFVYAVDQCRVRWGWGAVVILLGHLSRQVKTHHTQEASLRRLCPRRTVWCIYSAVQFLRSRLSAPYLSRPSASRPHLAVSTRKTKKEGTGVEGQTRGPFPSGSNRISSRGAL